MAVAARPQIVNVRMPDGTVRQWNPATEPKPDSVGNGSRNGFLYNCYTHPLGRFFQNTIKGAIIGVIRRLHDKDIPRYDRQAYVFDDQRLQALDRILTAAILEAINDADCERKREILLNCKDICLFMLKEDIFYRPRILLAGVSAAKEILANEEMLTTLSEAEAYNVVRYADGTNHLPDLADLPPEERAKLPKNWTGLP
jgi:hypothetical protein